MYDVQAARGAHRVQVSVRDDAVRDPPLPGAARVRVRLQGDGERADREGESGGEGREARQDLKRMNEGCYGNFVFIKLVVMDNGCETRVGSLTRKRRWVSG